MNTKENLKHQYDYYEEILKVVYDIKKETGNTELNQYIQYLKGIKKGIKISMSS